MPKSARPLGYLLIVLSLLSVLQTIREFALWEMGLRRYDERSPLQLPFTFAGKSFGLRDNLPVSNTFSEREYDGTIQPLIDGQPLGSPSRARVRAGRADMGRYHLWYDAWVFRDRVTGDSTLWLARRLQPEPHGATSYELVTVGANGTIQTRMYRGWSLALDYRRYRATNMLRENTWQALPLAMGDALGLFPPLVLVFPVGSFVLGLLMVRRRARPE